MFVVWSVSLCRAQTSSEIESNTSPILFKSRGNLEISGRSYHSILEVSVGELLASISPIGDTIKEIAAGLENTLNQVSPSRRSHEMELAYSHMNRSINDRFDSMTVALSVHMRDHMDFLMKDLIDKHRQLNEFVMTLDKNEDMDPNHSKSKRGIVDGGGSILRWLFGVATEDEIVDTQSLVKKVSELAEKTRVQLNLHSEILNTTAVNFKHVDDHMSKLTKCLNQVRGNILALTTIVQTGEANSYTLAHAIILTNSLSYASSAISDISSQFLSLKIGLNKFKSGFLSPEIVPPSTILNLIDVITRKNLKPIYPSSQEYLPILYKFIRVDPIPLRPLTYIISIPLLGDPKINLGLYEVFNMPHPVNNRLTITYSGLPTYLAVSDDRRIYQEFQDMHSCRNHGSFYLCSKDMPVYRDEAPSCALSLFMQKDDRVCERHFSGPLKKPLLVKSSVGWLYSVSQNQEISITCPKNTTRVRIPTGSGRIHTESNCKISAKDFILPSEAQPTGKALQFQASLVAPFKVSLTDDEVKKIDIMGSSDLLTNIMVLNEDKLPLDSLKSEVKNLAYIKKMRQINSITANAGMALSTISFIGVVLIIMTMICFYIVARDNKKRQQVVQYFSGNANRETIEQQPEYNERLVDRSELEVDRPHTLELPPIELEEVRRPPFTPRSPIPTERHTKVISQEEQHFDKLQRC